MSQEFLVLVERPAITWLLLPHFFREMLGTDEPTGLWLQADGCCSGALWVEVKVTPTGNSFLSHGWQTFTRAHGLEGRPTLHFKHGGAAMLFVKIFGEDGRRQRRSWR